MGSFERPAPTLDAEDMRLEGAVRGALSEIAADYEISRSHLAWMVLKVMRDQMERDEGLAANLIWSKRAAEIMGDEVDAIMDVIEADEAERSAA